jgi:hypothetical protein
MKSGIEKIKVKRKVKIKIRKKIRHKDNTQRHYEAAGETELG